MTSVSFPHGLCLCVCVQDWLKKKNSVHITIELYNWSNISKDTFLRRGLLYRNLLSAPPPFFLITVSPKGSVVLLTCNSFYYAYFATYYRTYSTDCQKQRNYCVPTPLTRHIYQQCPSIISLCELSNTAHVLETQKLKIWPRVLFRLMTVIRLT